MSAGLEYCVAFSKLCMIKFSIVYEGQETRKNTTWKLPLDYYVTIQHSALSYKCDNDEEERKEQTWPVFSDNIAK